MAHAVVRWLALVFLLAAVPSVESAEWSVPVAGNAFRSAPSPGGDGFSRRGGLRWGDPEGRFSIYFHVDRPAVLNLAIRAMVPQGQSQIEATVEGQVQTVSLSGDELATHEIGQVEVAKAGYVQVDLRGLERTGPVYAEIRDLVVTSETEGLALDYVKTNDGNMFYWGRRGPSVHLTYQVPQRRLLKYAYSEITVAEGDDPIGSYFMANGFAEGYFGIQVNSPTERRVLFSVWSPFQTDNPREIPEDQRIELLASGPEVRVGEFGNEGSGGQSFLVFPWRAGVTYRFLTEVVPEEDNKTRYTSWFAEGEEGPWRLIASFRRPQTSTHLRGFHSFLENFNPTYGHIPRKGQHGNVWVCDTAGTWHECTAARFSVDATGKGRHRLDFAGGAEGQHFWMQNGGFFSETVQPGETFVRKSNPAGRPEIDFEDLPR